MELPVLYAILDADAVVARHLAPLAVLDAWLAAGVRLVQLRSKTMGSGPMVELADECVRRARLAGAAVIVNDRADVARMSGSAGVHVGQADLAPGAARAVVGPSAAVGLSTHSEAQVAAAIGEPIDYIAIGPVYETSTKDQPDQVVGLDGIRRARLLARPAGLPLVGIGGITSDRARAVIHAGASSVAVIADLLAGDPEARAREFLRALR
jgi:thiamine-phosphate pyrophosphorylase